MKRKVYLDYLNVLSAFAVVMLWCEYVGDETYLGNVIGKKNSFYYCYIIM